MITSGTSIGWIHAPPRVQYLVVSRHDCAEDEPNQDILTV
jgi:hypothetical protein